MLASRLGICENYAQGKPLWTWVKRIAGLKSKKLFWDPALDRDDTEMFAISADGVDFKVWERKHPVYNIDTKACSHKFRSCGAKYIIALSVYRTKSVLIDGPYPGGCSDKEMFQRSGLTEKLVKNRKVAIVDRGFRAKDALTRKHQSYPDNMDSAELNNFKSRTCLQQETFNRRLTHFEVLSNTFRHGFENHGFVLKAVAVMVQYQMDNGLPVYSV